MPAELQSGRANNDLNRSFSLSAVCGVTTTTTRTYIEGRAQH